MKAGREGTESARLGASWLALPGLLSLLASALWMHTVDAQNERHGLRVHYTSLGAAGGVEGQAFMPVAPSNASLVADGRPACRGHIELKATAKLNNGPIRGVALKVSLRDGVGKAELAATSCARAELATTLDDGSVLRDGHGFVEVSPPTSAGDPTLRGRFSQTVLRAGVPVTIDGRFAVARPKR